MAPSEQPEGRALEEGRGVEEAQGASVWDRLDENVTVDVDAEEEAERGGDVETPVTRDPRRVAHGLTGASGLAKDDPVPVTRRVERAGGEADEVERAAKLQPALLVEQGNHRRAGERGQRDAVREHLCKGGHACRALGNARARGRRAGAP